jgi:hypothetical protein
MPVEDKTRRLRLQDELKKIPKPAPLPMTMALENTNGPAPKTFVLGRGDYNNPGEEVQAGFPAVLHRGRGEIDQGLPAPGTSKERSRLAGWITSRDNPLTARVMVNRLWQHHFGRGIVTTPSDFGTRGAQPTHPGLLDWLAGEFVTRGWSMKAMHKLILLSATYQQSSQSSDDALARDPDNKLFSRQNRIRLEGEAIRDSLLAISGRLNPRMGGPPVSAEAAKTSKKGTASRDSVDGRRSIYLLARRNLRVPFFEVFDAPDNNLTCPERGRSTTAPQSLTLLNSNEVMDAARGTAGRVRSGAATTPGRVNLAFRLIVGRPPTSKELSLAREFIKARYRQDEPGGTDEADGDYSELCRALFNLNAFVYVD